jgi:hypothetical protein
MRKPTTGSHNDRRRRRLQDATLVRMLEPKPKSLIQRLLALVKKPDGNTKPPPGAPPRRIQALTGRFSSRIR